MRLITWVTKWIIILIPLTKMMYAGEKDKVSVGSIHKAISEIFRFISRS